jgi:hypothetical protein
VGKLSKSSNARNNLAIFMGSFYPLPPPKKLPSIVDLADRCSTYKQKWRMKRCDS